MARTKKIKDENGQIEQMEPISETKSENENNIIESILNDGKTFADHVTEIETTKEEITPAPEPEKPKEQAQEFDLNKIMAEYGQPVPEEKRRRKPRKLKTEPEPARMQFIIPGRLFVTVCDNVAVSGIGAFDAWVSKNPMDTNLLKLSEQQIQDLAPAAEEAIKAMKLENDPISVYFGSLAAIYISNYLAIKALILKQEKNKKS